VREAREARARGDLAETVAVDSLDVAACEGGVERRQKWS
jgi:hypothetical protein